MPDNNLKLTGGGGKHAGLHPTHMKVWKHARGRSQKNSTSKLVSGLTPSSCDCSNSSLDLWCEMPFLTYIGPNTGASCLTGETLETYVGNIITFCKTFKTQNIVIRLAYPSPNIEKWSIKDLDTMYYALTGDWDPVVSGSPPPFTIDTSTSSSPPYYNERIRPFYKVTKNSSPLNDKIVPTIKGTLGYLVNELRTNNSSIKVYMLPEIIDGSEAATWAYIGNYKPALPPAAPYSGTRPPIFDPYAASIPDKNQISVDNFWSAVHFYQYLNDKMNSVGNYAQKFDGIIIETENSGLTKKSIPFRPYANAQVKLTYSLFTTGLTPALETTGGVGDFKTTPLPPSPPHDISFGLTGSPSISKTINDLDSIVVSGNQIKMNTLWPQYYNLADTGKDEQDAYNSVHNPDGVVNYIIEKVNWAVNDNTTGSEVMGMLSIEGDKVRKRQTTSTGNSIIDNVTNLGLSFFGRGGWGWNDICHVAKNAIQNRKCKQQGNTSATPIRAAIFTGSLLNQKLGSTTGEAVPGTAGREWSYTSKIDENYLINC